MQVRLSKLFYPVIALILLFLSFSAELDARRSRPNNFHFWSVGVSGGYATLLEDYSNLNTTGSFDISGHFGYEYENQGFWVSPALELQYYNTNSVSSVTMDPQAIRDNQTPQKSATMCYDMLTGLKETQRFLYVNLPVLVGYYSPEGFYFGAGLRLGLNIPVYSSASVTYRTSGDYKQYFDPFEDMPNHNYTTYTTYNDSVDLRSRFKVSLIAEIGYDLMAQFHKSKVKYSALKVGAFVEYGLNNVINTEGSGYVCNINPYNASELIPRSYYNAYHTNKHRVVPLVAGIKITFLFYVKGKGAYCPKCRRRFY